MQEARDSEYFQALNFARPPKYFCRHNVQAIDSFTDIPADVYAEFLEAGRRAQLSGQHQILAEIPSSKATLVLSGQRELRAETPSAKVTLVLASGDEEVIVNEQALSSRGRRSKIGTRAKAKSTRLEIRPGIGAGDANYPPCEAWSESPSAASTADSSHEPSPTRPCRHSADPIPAR